jgi:hypothetical protein
MPTAVFRGLSTSTKALGHPLVVALVLSFALLAGSLLAAAPARADAASERAYLALVKKVKNTEEGIDFTKMRMLYTKTRWYKPFGPLQNKARAAAQLAANGRFLDATTLVDEVLQTDYLNPVAHFAAAISYRQMRMGALATYHAAVLNAVIRSVRKSGDGKTQKTAFVVINVAEASMVLRAMNLTVVDSSRLKVGKKVYSKIEATDPDDKKVTVYLDTTIAAPYRPKDRKPAPKK